MNIALKTFLAGLFAAGTLVCQPKVNFGGDGSEPKNPMTFPGTSLSRYVLVTVPGTLLAEAREGSAAIRKTDFGQTFVVYNEDTTGQYFLVRTEAQPAVWGWIRKSGVLAELQCMRTEQKGGSTFLKVALKNNLRVSVTDTDTVSLRAGPGAAFRVVERDGLAEIFYVFDRRKLTDGTEYLLLGTDAQWDPARVSDSVIRGWARLEQCTVWDHRVAVYYNRKNIPARKPVAVYKTVEELKAGNTANAIAVESKDSDKALTYDKARFPVLQNGQLMKVAYIGDPSRQMKLSVSQINEKRDIARNMQVLFVIDGTTSMGRYFKAVQRAVRDYIASLPPVEQGRLHFAVAVYRDYEDGPKGEMEIVANFDDPAGLEKLGSLQEHSDPSDKTLEEAAFNGIIRSAKSVKWEKGNLKSIVVIGDHPNHQVDPRGYTIQSVVSELHKLRAEGAESDFRFYALNVNVTDKYRSLNNEFVNQMRQIGSQFKQAGKVEQIPSDGVDMEAFRRAVIQSLHGILETSGKVGDFLTKLSQGQAINELAPRYGTEITNLGINLLKELGIEPEVINLKGIKQLSQEGWVQMYDGREQLLEPWVYMERTEMEEFKGFLVSLIKASDQKQRASQIVKEAVTRATGDPLLQGETVAEYVKREFALPFRDDSTLLSKTPEELQRSLGDQSYWMQFRKRVGHSYESLALVFEERDPNALRWDEAQNKWVRTTPRPPEVKSWVTTKGGQKFCWIPMDFLP